MSKVWRVPSPRIVLNPVWGWTSRLILAALLLVIIIGAFLAGVLATREEAKGLAALITTLTRENLALTEQLDALRADKATLELSQRLDRDTLLAAQDGLKQELENRLALEKELSALKRLIRQGGGGILRIQDVILTPTAEEGVFAYSFTVSDDQANRPAQQCAPRIGDRPASRLITRGLKAEIQTFSAGRGKAESPVRC